MYDTTHASVQASEANAENKVLIYFQEKTTKQLKNEADIKSMKYYIYEIFALIYLLTVLAMSIPMIFLVKHVARRVTIQIVKLHDVIKINLKQKQEHLTLSYLPVNKELSTLHLEFNKAARTLKITSESEASSNYKQAQLNYHEAYLIFKDFSN